MTTPMDKAMRDKAFAETETVLADLIENGAYEIPYWVRTCLRGVRQNIRALSPTLPGESGMRDKTIEECAKCADEVADSRIADAESSRRSGPFRNPELARRYEDRAREIRDVASKIRALSQSSKPPTDAKCSLKPGWLADDLKVAEKRAVSFRNPSPAVPSDEEMRAMYEAWFLTGNMADIAGLFRRLPNGDYFHQLVFAGWQAWRAAMHELARRMVKP